MWYNKLMDNGQTPQSMQPNSQDFFTPGVGLSSEENNPLDKSLNLNADGFQSPEDFARQQAIQTNMGYAALGGHAQSGEQTGDNDQSLIDDASAAMANQAPGSLDFMPLPSDTIPEAVNPQLGQIVELDTPTLVDNDTNEQSPKDDDAMRKHFADAKIDQNDLKLIQSTEKQLEQDDDIAKFYDFWQEARSDARENAKKEEV